MYSHDTKLRVPTGAVYYPDVFVACTEQDDPYVEDDARWVLEVLSETTRDKDEREKSLAYLQLPSIPGYVLAEYLHDDDVLDLDGVKVVVPTCTTGSTARSHWRRARTEVRCAAGPRAWVPRRSGPNDTGVTTAPVREPMEDAQ